MSPRTSAPTLRLFLLLLGCAKILPLVAAEPTPTVVASTSVSATDFNTRGLPFSRVFIGQERFDQLLPRIEPIKDLPLGQRIAIIGRALTGTPYKGFTLELDDHIECPSVNLYGLDCWTYFEVSLALARMIEEPRANWTPATMLRYIEMDRYRGGHCDGYLSRLHYLEDWLQDNQRRGLVRDLTRQLGGIPAPHSAVEMQRAWRSYRQMRADPAVRAGIARMEDRISDTPLYFIPKSRVPDIEPQLQSGDIISICSHDGALIGTSHVGLAYRTPDGILHFMHASAPHNAGKVILDQRLSGYLEHFHTDAGIMVARPLR